MGAGWAGGAVNGSLVGDMMPGSDDSTCSLVDDAGGRDEVFSGDGVGGRGVSKDSVNGRNCGVIGSVGVRAIESTRSAEAGLTESSAESSCVSLIDEIGREGNGVRVGV